MVKARELTTVVRESSARVCASARVKGLSWKEGGTAVEKGVAMGQAWAVVKEQSTGQRTPLGRGRARATEALKVSLTEGAKAASTVRVKAKARALLLESASGLRMAKESAGATARPSAQV